MDVNYDIEILENNSQCLEILPVGIQRTKLTFKQKLCVIIKRIADIIIGLLGLIFLIPVTIGVFIAHKITRDDGGVFYRQYRIGKDGIPFVLLKFRSMVSNADEELEKYLLENEEMQEEYIKYKKLRNDPRITKVGRFLRRTSLDELPQIINVLKGEMSIVGNRPYLLREKDDMGSYYTHIVKTKPGITGLWQVSGRNDITFDERVKLESIYSLTNTLKGDFKILIRTARVVLKKEGAI